MYVDDVLAVSGNFDTDGFVDIVNGQFSKI